MEDVINLVQQTEELNYKVATSLASMCQDAKPLTKASGARLGSNCLNNLAKLPRLYMNIIYNLKARDAGQTLEKSIMCRVGLYLVYGEAHARKIMNSKWEWSGCLSEEHDLVANPDRCPIHKCGTVCKLYDSTNAYGLKFHVRFLYTDHHKCLHFFMISKPSANPPTLASIA